MPALSTEDPAAAQTGPSDSLLRLIADSVPALMAYFELPSLLCRFANQGYAAYHGQTPDAMLNRTVEEAIGLRAWQSIAPYVERCQRGERVKYTREQTLPNGEARMIEVQLIPHMGSAPEPVGAFALINDITERWRADQAMHCMKSWACRSSISSAPSGGPWRWSTPAGGGKTRMR